MQGETKEMSEDNQAAQAADTETAAAQAPRRHVRREELAALLAARGLVPHEMTSFDRVGPKDGPHMTISRAKKIVRVYGHGFQLDRPGVTCFTAEQRKERNLGGITCQLDVEGSEPETATAALAAMLDEVAVAQREADAKAATTETPSSDEG